MTKKTKNHPYSAKNVNPINCICCDAEITLLYPEVTEREDSQISSEMWNNGVVQEISAGYGSDKDGDVYLIGICDKCLDIKRNNGNAIFLYDYMGTFNDKETRERYNKKLHRRMKLNRIMKDDDKV